MADPNELHQSEPVTPLTLQKQKLELEKLSAEVRKVEMEGRKLIADERKIEAEVRALTSKWQKCGRTLMGLSPTFVAIAGIYLLHNSRWFEVQNEKLELKGKYLNETNVLLIATGVRLESGIKGLEERKALYERRIKDLEFANQALSQERGALSNIVIELKAERNVVTATNEMLRTLVAQLDKVEAERNQMVAAAYQLHNELDDLRMTAMTMYPVPFDWHAGQSIQASLLRAQLSGLRFNAAPLTQSDRMTLSNQLNFASGVAGFKLGQVERWFENQPPKERNGGGLP